MQVLKTNSHQLHAEPHQMARRCGFRVTVNRLGPSCRSADLLALMTDDSSDTLLGFQSEEINSSLKCDKSRELRILAIASHSLSGLFPCAQACASARTRNRTIERLHAYVTQRPDPTDSWCGRRCAPFPHPWRLQMARLPANRLAEWTSYLDEQKLDVAAALVDRKRHKRQLRDMLVFLSELLSEEDEKEALEFMRTCVLPKARAAPSAGLRAPPAVPETKGSPPASAVPLRRSRSRSVPHLAGKCQLQRALARVDLSQPADLSRFVQKFSLPVHLPESPSDERTFAACVKDVKDLVQVRSLLSTCVLSSGFPAVC